MALAIGGTNLPAQDTPVDNQLWVDFTADYRFSSRWLLDQQFRLEDELSGGTPWAGAELSFYPGTRFHIKSLTRIEMGDVIYLGADSVNVSWRFRTRLGGDIAINHRNLITDGTVWASADVEAFANLSGSISETHASRLRIRGGLGYRLSYRWRCSALYVFESSRDTGGGGSIAPPTSSASARST